MKMSGSRAWRDVDFERRVLPIRTLFSAIPRRYTPRYRFRHIDGGPRPSHTELVLARLRSATLRGIEAPTVFVEVDVTSGLPSFSTVGLPVPAGNLEIINKKPAGTPRTEGGCD